MYTDQNEKLFFRSVFIGGLSLWHDLRDEGW